MANFNELEVIKLAISMEEEGMTFYNKGVNNTDGELKKFLKTAAEQERVHKNRFEKLYDKYKETTLIDDDYIFDPEVAPYFKQQVENTVFDKADESAFKDLKTAVLKAIKAEKDSVGFYGKIKEASRKDEIKTILSAIIKEEEEHVKYFENVLSKLEE